MLGVAGIPALLFFVLLFFVPESPRFLVKIGQTAKAKIILEKIMTLNIDEKIEEMRLSMIQSSSLKQNLFSKKYSKPLTIAFLVAMFNQLSGINAILYYAPRIFELSGLSVSDSLFQSILIGVTNGIFTILGLVLIDQVGRKKLLIVGSIGMSICPGLISKTFYTQDFTGNGLLIFLLTYIMFFGFSTGAVIMGSDCRGISKPNSRERTIIW